jgi:hypothetical protein
MILHLNVVDLQDHIIVGQLFCDLLGDWVKWIIRLRVK